MPVAEAGTAEREAFICRNLGLVHACARRFNGRGIEYDDLYQAGCLGLIKAADGFEPERGLQFSTYAVPVILGEMRRLFREGGTVKVSRSLRELSLRATRARERLLLENGREPTVEELAAALQVEPALAAQAITAGLPAVSLTAGEEEGRSGSWSCPPSLLRSRLPTGWRCSSCWRGWRRGIGCCCGCATAPIRPSKPPLTGWE